MAAKDRLDAIKNTIQIEKKVVVSELSSMFGVTEETIRRDLEKLENEGVLNRTFGGAVLNVESQREGIHFYQRAAIHVEEKKKMALAFANILNTKSTIMADASTSVMEAVRLIKNSRDVTILTTSIEMIHELAQTDIKIISTGGTFKRSTLSLQGKIAKDNIKNYHVEIALISCKGIDIDKGAMDSEESEAEVKKIIIEQANEVALFVDHTKFDKTAFAQLMELEKVTYIITDQEPDTRWKIFCEENMIKLIY